MVPHDRSYCSAQCVSDPFSSAPNGDFVQVVKKRCTHCADQKVKGVKNTLALVIVMASCNNPVYYERPTLYRTLSFYDQFLPSSECFYIFMAISIFFFFPLSEQCTVNEGKRKL